MPKSEKIFKEIAAKLDKLEHNPIYHFSLSNKELFHSNFIAWFFQEYVIGEEQYNVRNLKILGNIFPPNIKKKITQDYLILKKVQRECKNIDLTFDFKQHKTPDEQAEIKLYLENKIKSVPNKSQLYSYSLKLAGGKKKQAFSSYECILLSLMRPVCFKQGNDKITFSIYDTEEKKDTLQVKKKKRFMQQCHMVLGFL